VQQIADADSNHDRVMTMTAFMWRRQLQIFQKYGGEMENKVVSQSIKILFGTTVQFAVLLMSITAGLVCEPMALRSQTLARNDDSGKAESAAPGGASQSGLIYVRPTQATMARNYAFDTFGPYPVVGAAITAGVNQASNAPPEWKQGFQGYSKRFGSDFGIAAVATTTRYGLAEAFKEDTLYYRCECSGLFPRARHALASTLTGRHGGDGHRVFSIPALVAPYAGSMAAVYGWYPNRFNAKDGFRLGNYSLLLYAGGNLALEFFYSGPHSMLARMHLNNAHGSPVEGPNQ
jgi:hypothetical protein